MRIAKADSVAKGALPRRPQRSLRWKKRQLL